MVNNAEGAGADTRYPRPMLPGGLVMSLLVMIGLYNMKEWNLSQSLNTDFAKPSFVEGNNKSTIISQPLGLPQPDEQRCDSDKNGTILAFGDSLTSGFPIDHPYQIQLSTLLHNAKVVQKGVPGEMASNMLSRFKSSIEEAQPYLVIILGGTNDIMRNTPPSDTIADIIALHEYAQTWSKQHNNMLTHTIAITAPDIYHGKFDYSRMAVNEGIREYVSRSNGVVKLLDLESSFNQSIPEKKIYWYEDSLHFSVLGYDTIAAMIHNTICSIED